jgi:hypothetical protein
VRRTQYRTESRESAISVLWGKPRRSKSESGVEMLNSTADFRTFMALQRTGRTNQSTLHIVKSFAVLSVRERSSGNSVAKTAHNSRLTKAIPSVLTIVVRLGILQ